VSLVCSTLQQICRYVATHCVAILQHTVSQFGNTCVATCNTLCNTLQQMSRYFTTHCNTCVARLQHTATNESLSGDTLQHMCATHCNTCAAIRNTLQHTATHCNTLQHMCRYFATHSDKYVAIWRGGISKVSLLLNLLNKMTTELTFEKFYHQRVRESLGSRNLWCVYGVVCV